MRLNSRKVFGFVIIISFLILIIILLLIFDREILKEHLGKIITALITAFIILVGGNSIDKATTSIWFKKDKWENNYEKDEINNQTNME